MVSSTAAYLVFLGAIGLERLFELRLSKRNAARAFARGGVEVGQRHFRVMALVHTAFLFACAGEVLVFEREFPGALGWAALIAALGAQALRYWAITSLGDRWNVRIIFVPGDEPVTRGPYQYLRHPNYVAVIVEMIAVPLVHGAFVTAAVFSAANAALLFVRIRAEERALGAAYARTFHDRPRFVPGTTRS